jgi:hypothetical protein
MEIVSAVRESFSNAYPDKEVPNKTTIHRLVTTIRGTGSVCDRKHVRRRPVLTGETLLNAEETLARSPQKSLRKWPSKVTSAHPATKETSIPFSARLLSVGISQRKSYSINPRSLEELEHSIEQTVANTDPDTLCKFVLNTLTWVDACSVNSRLIGVMRGRRSRITQNHG